MHAIENKATGWRSAAGIGLAALGLTLSSCATKSAALHSAPLFSPAPNRETINAIDAGDGNLEIATLRRNMMARPEDVDIRLQLAQAYASRGFPDVALEHYRLAAERFPESARVAVLLARALRQADQKEEALTGLAAFIHAHPQNSSEPYEWLGILHDDLQNWKGSQLAYETALLYAPKASPASAELHNNLGYSLLMQYLNDAAVAEFRSALRLRKDLTIARNNLGIALADNPKEAILHWQTISGPAAAHNNMAALLIERGQYQEARKELATALGYDQHNAQAIYNLALVSERDGKPAVLSARVPEATIARTTRQGNYLMRLLHPGRHYSKPADGQPQTADRAMTPASSGSSN